MTAGGDATPVPRLPDTLRLGAVQFTVADLDRSLAFYERALGLRVHESDGGRARLGAGGEDLLVLHEEPGATPGGRHAGLFHYALLYPTRRELALALERLASARTPLEGAADHGVSEAIYLHDPDRHGIELYADRPRDAWPAPRRPGERIEIFTIPLDLDDLLRAAAGEAPPTHAEPGLVMGHVHLHVGDIAQALAFYRDVLGFELMVGIGSAAFLSAGGYHHHLGVNVWLGPDVAPPPAGAAALREWTVVLDSDEHVGAVRARLDAAGVASTDRDGGGLVTRDPWQTAVAITAG